jgi:hypothetical protein
MATRAYETKCLQKSQSLAVRRALLFYRALIFLLKRSCTNDYFQQVFSCDTQKRKFIFQTGICPQHRLRRAMRGQKSVSFLIAAKN